MTIGLEFGVTAGADMMKHENGADAGENRPQQVMRPGEVQRTQAGADDVAAKLLHAESAGRFGCNCETSGKPLNKQLFGPRRFSRTLLRYFGFDSPARVCFLSVPDPRDIECTDFTGGAANGGRAQFHWSSFGLSRPGPVPHPWKPTWPPALRRLLRIPSSTRRGSRSPAATSASPPTPVRKMYASAPSQR